MAWGLGFTDPLLRAVSGAARESFGDGRSWREAEKFGGLLFTSWCVEAELACWIRLASATAARSVYLSELMVEDGAGWLVACRTAITDR